MSTPTKAGTANRPEAIKAVPVRHPGRWVAVAVIALLVAMFVHSVFTNPNWEWSFQWQNAFRGPVLHGVWTTIWLTIAAMAMGVLLGIVLSVMRLSPNPVLSGAAWFYIWVFRGTPVLVQLVIWAQPRLAVPQHLPRVSRSARNGSTSRPATSSRPWPQHCSASG